MVIICDISAWQYWRTPPIIKNSEVPLELAVAPSEDGGLGMDRALFSLRANAREAERLISGRILTDLKGLTLPIHVMVDEHVPRRHHEFLRFHRLPSWIAQDDLVSLGNGLFVLTAAGLFATLDRAYGHIDIGGCMNEACGIYTLFHPTPGASLILDKLTPAERSALSSLNTIRYYYDSTGKPVSFDRHNEEEPFWSPTFKNNDSFDSYWKRPPLCSKEQLVEFFEKHPDFRNSRRFRKALSLVQDGSASPLETQISMLLMAPAALGGEALPSARLNQKISLTAPAQKLAGTTYCVGDAVWENLRTVFEANGSAFHSDSNGFYTKSGRISALQHMGYTVHEMNYAQLTDLKQYEAIVETLCESLEVAMQPRSSSFKAAHEALRGDIFNPNRLWG